jgi:DNA-directed RNA polymerase subunit E"
MSEKACKTCRRLVRGNICPICKSSAVTPSWKGVLVVFDANSEIAKEAGITAVGKYAIRVK